MKINDLEQLSEVLEDFGGETIAVRTRIGDLFLVFDTEDGDPCYQGVPLAEDEDGTSVDHNVSYVAKLSDLHWPMDLVTPYKQRERDWRARRLDEPEARMTVASALWDNHTPELTDAALPDIRAALALTVGHPDADALMDRAYQACRDAFPEEGGWHAEAAELAFRLLVGVVYGEAVTR